MKPTQEQVIAWANEVKLCGCKWVSDDDDRDVESLCDFAALAYEAGRKDENEAIAQMIEDAPPLVDFAKNEQGGCVICGFTPKLAAFTIRERMRHE